MALPAEWKVSLMRRTIGPLVSAVILSALLCMPSATAVVLDRDTGFDPDDVDSPSRFDPDIRSSTRKLSTRDGRRVLAIIVRFYERDAGWGLGVRLDARGGHRADHLMSTLGQDCYVWPSGSRGERVQGRASAHGERFVCRVPARVVSPNKSIRWKIHTHVPDGSRLSRTDFEIDYAPDQGWYS